MRSTLSPIPPRIRLRIGVTGHRVPPKLPSDSETAVRALLDRIVAVIVKTAGEVQSEYAACIPQPAASDPCEFAVISSLAEGSDRLVAEAGLAAGFRLEVVLPVGRTEYAHDFPTETSQAAFQNLLDRASAVFELDGVPEDRPRAYEAAGFVMLANIDVLIAIWDGNDAAGIGGTAQIVSRALADGIPIVWIEPANPECNTIIMVARLGRSSGKLQRASKGNIPRRRRCRTGACDRGNRLPTSARRSSKSVKALSGRSRATLEFLSLVSATFAPGRTRPALDRFSSPTIADRFLGAMEKILGSYAVGPGAAAGNRKYFTSCF